MHTCLFLILFCRYTVIIRRVFGVGGAALVDRAELNERCAWPSADWGSLPLEGGVEAAYKRQLRESDNPEKLKEQVCSLLLLCLFKILAIVTPDT